MTLVVVSAIAFGWGFTRSGNVLVAGLATALCLTIAAIASLRIRKSPLPTKIVPVDVSPLFARRLTGSSIMVGRSPCCDVVVPLPTVSGHHCRFHRCGQHWYIEDLASRNGILVNNRRVQRQRLRIGDVISIGEFQFTVE